MPKHSFAKVVAILLPILATALPPATAHARTDLIFWHSMPGALGQWINDLADTFNRRNVEFRVVTVYKGSYDQSMRAALDAQAQGHPPHIVQVNEVGTASMMAAPNAIRPVYRVMEQAGQELHPESYLPAIRLYYADLEGRLLSLPFNSSTPVLVYDRHAFAIAGLDPARPPETWPAMEQAARALRHAGYACGFTSQWQSWILLENTSAWHDVAFASQQNGLAGLDVTLLFNSAFHVAHIAHLADWARQGLMTPPSHRDEALKLFLDGTCPMLLATSAVYSELRRRDGLDFAIAMLPYWPEVERAPRNSIIGGATLWVMNGLPEGDYAGIAAFFQYLSSPEVQLTAHQRTGYLPISRAAYSASRRQGFYQRNPGADTAIRQITLHWPSENSRGVRLGDFAAIRAVIDQQLDAIWAGRVSAQAGLNEAVRQGNQILAAFAAAQAAPPRP